MPWGRQVKREQKVICCGDVTSLKGNRGYLPWSRHVKGEQKGEAGWSRNRDNVKIFTSNLSFPVCSQDGWLFTREWQKKAGS